MTTCGTIDRLRDRVFSAFVIQFSFVACFFWLNVMCIETWSLVRHHVNHRTYKRIQPKTLFFYYSIWAWGPPAILILVSMAMDLSPTIPMTYVKPTFGSESCWFKCEFRCDFQHRSFSRIVHLIRYFIEPLEHKSSNSKRQQNFILCTFSSDIL